MSAIKSFLKTVPPDAVPPSAWLGIQGAPESTSVVKGVRVLSVAPGWVSGEYASRADPAYLAEQIARTPLGRIATPGDVAEAVYAACTALGFTTGAILPVDGGRPLA